MEIPKAFEIRIQIDKTSNFSIQDLHSTLDFDRAKFKPRATHSEGLLGNAP